MGIPKVIVTLLLLLAAAAGARAADVMLITGLDVRMTSGTVELQHLRADRAELAPDAMSILASGVEMTSQIGTSERVTATAPTAVIVLRKSATPGTRAVLPPPDLPAIRDLDANFLEQARFGDLMLLGDKEPTAAALQSGGNLYAERIIWSQSYNRLILPRPFKQVREMPDGSIVTTSGGALSVDRQVTLWEYFAPDNEPGVLIFEPTASPTKAAP